MRDNLYDPSYIRQPGKVIKNDLEEVANAYREQGFDLWEEVYVSIHTSADRARADRRTGTGTTSSPCSRPFGRSRPARNSRTG